MKGLVKAFDNLPKIVKLILCIPVISIVWGIYRLCRSIAKKSLLGIILGIIMLFVNAAIFWIVDIITIILFNKVLWIH